LSSSLATTWRISSVTVVQSEPESFRTDENLHFTN
jgi:hypothetical protein